MEKLENHDIYTVKDFFTRTKWDLVEILDAPMDQVTQVVFAVAKAVAPEPVTVRMKRPLLLILIIFEH